MRFTTLLALSSTLLLSSLSPSLAHFDYGGGARPQEGAAPAPPPAAAHAQPAGGQHRRHHSKVASAVLSGLSSGESPTLRRGAKRAGAPSPSSKEEEEEGTQPAHPTSAPSQTAPYGGEFVTTAQPPIVGNTTAVESPSSSSSATSSSASSTATARRLPANPAYHGPVPIGDDTATHGAHLKRATQKTGWSLKGLKKGGVAFGFLPDDGSGGGQSETIEMIEKKLGVKASAQGWYAQVQPNKPFDGAQFEARKEQILNSDGVFQATVMPVTWQGFTWEDNSQAVHVAKYCQKWIDAGKEVWLRFAHEVNYYQTENTYQGDVNDFKLGWAVMAKAATTSLRMSSSMQMWFTPNFANMAVYDKFYPDDPKTVDLIGVDWYPHQTSNFDFANGPADMKKFHDKYTNDRVKFAIGEIGLGIPATVEQRLAWAKNVIYAKKVMPNFIACSWFNYWKDKYSYKLVDDHGDDVVVKYFRAT